MLETQHRIPTVTFCTEPFRTLTQARIRSEGLAALPIIYLPHPMMPRKPDQVQEIVGRFVDQIIDGLLLKEPGAAP